MQEADELCDRIAIISGGEMVALDTVEGLKSKANMANASLEDVYVQLVNGEVAS